MKRTTWILAAAAVGALEPLASAVEPADAAAGEERADVALEERAAGAAPERLGDTGLYADAASRTLHPDVVTFVPQYPLWSDGATKRRFLRLPKGASIDASDPDHWVFPVGTKLWKEFSFGRRVETRYMERLADGSWRFDAYVWSEDGTDAVRMPEGGVRGAVEIRPGLRHDVPGVLDCKACHEGPRSPVLGVTALQLSPDRDPNAPHAEPLQPGDVDLPELVGRGLVRGLPAELLASPPRIPARTPRERAVLGYLAANCAGCHSAKGPLASLGMFLEQGARSGSAGGPLPTAVGAPSEFRPPGSGPTPLRIDPGAPGASVLLRRMASRSPLVQMPPLGTHAVDEEAVALVRAWIEDLSREPTKRSNPRVAVTR
jgi:hypothetical protein